MLRVVVVLLVLANALFFAWERGYLGEAPQTAREGGEPERLAQQIRPQDIRLLNAPAAPNAGEGSAADAATATTSAPATPSSPTPVPGSESTPTPTPVATSPTPAVPSPPPPAASAAPATTEPPTRCWVASGFTAAQAQALRQALASQASLQGRWQLEEVRVGGRWVVFMGRYDDEQMARKKGELRALKVDFREVNVPGSGRGLALGTFPTEAAAQQALRDLNKRGVRSARVAMERSEGTAQQLMLPAITEAQRSQVALLGAAMGGKRLQPCD